MKKQATLSVCIYTAFLNGHTAFQKQTENKLQLSSAETDHQIIHN